MPPAKTRGSQKHVTHSKSQAKEIASAFCRDAEKDSDRREASNQAEVIAGTTAADEARQIGSSLNTHAHDKSDHEMQGAFCNGRQHYTQSAGSLQSAAIGQSDSDLKTPSHRKRHKKVRAAKTYLMPLCTCTWLVPEKRALTFFRSPCDVQVELRALVPNTTAFSYFLVSYDPNRASIQVRGCTSVRCPHQCAFTAPTIHANRALVFTLTNQGVRSASSFIRSQSKQMQYSLFLDVRV